MKRKMKSLITCVLVLLALSLAAAPSFAVIVYNDGLTHEISTPIGEDIQVYDGPAGQPTLIRLIAGADTSDVDVFENSRFEMTGGAIGDGELGLHDNSTGHISAGSIADDTSWIGDSSTLTITGIDLIDGLKLAGDARVFIHGSNFKLDEIPLGYGPITGPVGQLSGDLLYGQINCGIFFQSDTAVLTLIPEPTTVAFLAIGALALKRRRRV